MNINNKGIITGNNFIELPSEYTKVEYIESTGTQYIDTNIYPSSTDFFKYKISFNSDAVQQRIFCSRINDGKKAIFEMYVNGAKGFSVNITSSYEANLPLTPISTISTNTIYEVERVGRFKYKVNNDDRTVQNYTFSDMTYSEPIHVFGGEYVVSLGVRNFIGKLYYLEIFGKCNLLPCYRNSDNEIGMYDTVNNVFYSNSGTGTFSKGQDEGTILFYNDKFISKNFIEI